MALSQFSGTLLLECIRCGSGICCHLVVWHNHSTFMLIISVQGVSIRVNEDREKFLFLLTLHLFIIVLWLTYQHNVSLSS